VSFCTTTTCPHGERAFIRLDLGEPYEWAHSGGMAPCDLMPAATAEEAGEVCACGHPSVRHEAGPGPLTHGMVAKARPCGDCRCGDFTHRAEDLAARRERAAA
jgi:hypothetical protein